MNNITQNLAKKHQWISDAAYYNSLKHKDNSKLAQQDWYKAEQQYIKLMNERIKDGLIRIK